MNNISRTRIIFVAVVGTALLIVVAGALVRLIDGVMDGGATATPVPAVASNSSPRVTAAPGGQNVEPNTQGGRVIVSYWTNDTKAEWVHAVTEPFNERRVKTSTGKEVYVEVNQLSSGDVFPKIRAGEIQPTVWSPGDMGWVNEANVIWKDLTGRPLAATFTDTLPSQVDYLGPLTYTHGDGGYASGVVTWTGTVYTNTPARITWAVQVASDAPYSTTIPNVAVISDVVGTFQTDPALILVPPRRVYLPLVLRQYP
jgi:hypothetical protein